MNLIGSYIQGFACHFELYALISVFYCVKKWVMLLFLLLSCVYHDMICTSWHLIESRVLNWMSGPWKKGARTSMQTNIFWEMKWGPKNKSTGYLKTVMDTSIMVYRFCFYLFLIRFCPFLPNFFVVFRSFFVSFWIYCVYFDIVFSPILCLYCCHCLLLCNFIYFCSIFAVYFVPIYDLLT